MACTGAASGVPGHVAARVERGQLDRLTGRPRRPRRARRRPTRASSASSLRRNRCARTPPGRAALARVHLERRDLRGAGLGARERAGRARDGDDDRLGGVGRGPPRTRRPAGPAASLMPAMPPAARPCGRTADAGKCRSEASEEIEHELVGVGSTGDRADHLVAVLEGDHLPRVAVAGDVAGRHPLHRALDGRRARASARRRRARPGRPPARAAARVTTSPSGTPPDERGGAVGRAAAPGRSSTETRTIRPCDVTTPISATRGRRDRAAHDVVLGPRAHRRRGAGRSSDAVRASSPVADSSTQHGVSATSSGAAAPRAAGAPVIDVPPADSSRTVRRGVP